MTNEKLKRLELNLTKSAIKAPPGAVRYKYGVLEEEQGFIVIDSLPLYTYKEGEQILLSTFICDYKQLEADVKQLRAELDETKIHLENTKIEFEQKLMEQNEQLELLLKRIQDLELFHLD